MVLVSDLAAQKRRSTGSSVALAGTRSNRNGLGARCGSAPAGRRATQYNDGKSGYLSQSVLPLYFGLGDAGRGRSRRGRLALGEDQTVTSGLKLNGRSGSAAALGPVR